MENDAPQPATAPQRLDADELEALYSRAMGFLAAGLNERAIDALAGLAIVWPHEARLYRALGLAHQRLCRYGLAAALYQVALGLRSDDRIARALHAECTAFAGDTTTALTLLQQVVDDGAANAEMEPYLGRARLLLARLQRLGTGRSR